MNNWLKLVRFADEHKLALSRNLIKRPSYYILLVHDRVMSPLNPTPLLYCGNSVSACILNRAMANLLTSMSAKRNEKAQHNIIVIRSNPPQSYGKSEIHYIVDLNFSNPSAIYLDFVYSISKWTFRRLLNTVALGNLGIAVKRYMTLRGKNIWLGFKYGYLYICVLF